MHWHSMCQDHHAAQRTQTREVCSQIWRGGLELHRFYSLLARAKQPSRSTCCANHVVARFSWSCPTTWQSHDQVSCNHDHTLLTSRNALTHAHAFTHVASAPCSVGCALPNMPHPHANRRPRSGTQRLPRYLSSLRSTPNRLHRESERVSACPS